MIQAFKTLTGAASVVTMVGVSAAVAQSGGPSSAIPWLTDSLNSPPQETLESQGAASTEIEEISIERIGEPSRDALGILSQEITGLPSNLWQGLDGDAVKDLLTATPHAGVPANRALFRKLLLAEADLPGGSVEQDSLLITRIDRLLEIGALSEAQALIELAEPNTSALFRRWFDIGLLTNQADSACGSLDASPMLSPARSVQVFCLALGRDWDAAATALSLGEELGEIPTQEADLLSFFLDESLLEEIDPPPLGDPLTSMEFVIRESVGLPRPTAGLPLAFMHAELADFVPLRFRIEASEMLVREGVLPSSVLFAAYREETPAASGGIWDHMAATQAMDAAATADEISLAFDTLDTRLTAADLRLATAEEFLLYFSTLPEDQFEANTRNRVALYCLLAGAPELAEKWITSGAPEELSEALSIALQTNGTESEVLEVFSTSTPEALLNPYFDKVISGARIGEAVLAAITILAKGKDVDSGDLVQALALLRSVGQEDAARKIAVEHLVLHLDVSDAN